MSDKFPRQYFTPEYLARQQRVADAVLGATKKDGTPIVPRGLDSHLGRFRLRGALVAGRKAPAVRLYETTSSEIVQGKTYWVQITGDAFVGGVGAKRTNYLPKGTEVLCYNSGDYWVVIDAPGAALALPPPEDLKETGITKMEPYLILSVGGIRQEGKDNAPGYSLQANKYAGSGLILPDDSEIRSYYYALTGHPAETITPDDKVLGPDGNPEPVYVQGIPLGTMTKPCDTPVMVAYEDFDGKTTDGENLPEELQRFYRKGPPNDKELWGPSPRAKLTRRFSAIPLWWWEIVNQGEYESRPFTVHVWEPDHPQHQEYLDDPAAVDYNGGRYWSGGYVYVPFSYQEYWDRKYPPVTISYWVNTCNGSNSHIKATEDEPKAQHYFFVAPWGFWLNDVWRTNGYYGYFWDNYYWNPYYNYYYGSSWWGPWGGWNFWGGLWGTLPTKDNLPYYLTETEPPEVPCGFIVKRKLYGYMVWDYGWEVVPGSVNKEEKTCLVDGLLKVQYSVKEYDVEVPEPSPDE